MSITRQWRLGLRAWAIGVVALGALGCKGSDDRSDVSGPVGVARSALEGGDACTGAQPESPDAAAYLVDLKARFRVPVGPFPLVDPLSGLPGAAPGDTALIGDSVVACVIRDGESLVPIVRKSAEQGVKRTSGVALPIQSSNPARIVDRVSGVSVQIAMRGTRRVMAEVADGYVVYRDVMNGASLVARVGPEGTEDFIVWGDKPPKSELHYELGLGAGAAGLRLVANVLEVLDAGGNPCLRLRPPVVLAQGGERQEGELAVQGCKVDTSAAVPWGRPVTPPGKSVCGLRVGWKDSVQYPAMVDPAWTSTGNMTDPRSGHAAVALGDGRVLVAGGRNDSSTALSTAEIYDPVQQTWATTASMTAARSSTRAVFLPSNGKVMVVGGTGSQGVLKSAELWDPQDPQAGWTSAGAMYWPRNGHTATVLASGRVLVAGGVSSGPPTTALSSAEVYDPSADSWSFVGSMSTGRLSHVAGLLASGRVLVVGGNGGPMGPSTVDYSSSELFEEAPPGFHRRAA